VLQADQPVEGGTRPAPKIARLGVRLFVALAATGIVAIVGYSFVPSKQAPAPPDEISIAAALQALERGDFALATPALRTWAEAGDAGAQFALARMYANGRGVPEDGKAAELWYRRAGRQGDARALAELGRLYLDGKKVPQNSREALKLFEEAASKGSALGALELGLIYYEGGIVPKDYELAFQHFQRAARNGSVAALDRLAYMTQHGHGTISDIDAAIDLYRRAAAQGFERSIKRLHDFGVPINTEELNASLSTLAPNEIPIRYDGSSYYVDALIAGTEKLTFKLDSGATSSSIPHLIIQRLRADGVLTEQHARGPHILIGWNGNESVREIWNIPSIQIGHAIVNNVRASESTSEDSTLLGVSFLGRFRTWSIDNERRVLTLGEPLDLKPPPLDSVRPSEN
jgi:gag-polyprotein putative aspartyl protease/Sel1 repeat